MNISKQASFLATMTRVLHSSWRARRLLLPVGFTLLLGSLAAACDCGCESAITETAGVSWVELDFLTNYGNYMPRVHCLQNEAGAPDWPWIIGLIALNVVVVAGYLKIVFFWRRCYLDEALEDRDQKLKDLALIFILCAVCGYGFSILIFFWPAYRLLAMVLVGLAFVTWRFALDLEPFRKSFSANRLQRQLNDALMRENTALEEKNEELLRAHQALESATAELKQTNADLDEFVYAASHDLRSPLRAIDSLAQFVIEDAADELSAGPREDLLQLRGRVQRMDRLLNGLLNYSRTNRQNYPAETFTVQDACQQSTDVLNIPADFQINLPTVEIEITSPRPPLEQVLRNLVDNAVKHHDRDNGEINILVEDCGDFVEFVITDDGPGISPEHCDRVFEMFKTLKRRDEVDTNGLGLAMVKRVVESYGGTISIDPSSERGTTFRFQWPKTHAGSLLAQPVTDESNTRERNATEEVCYG